MPRPAPARPLWCIRAASARSSRPSPSSAAACWKKPPAFPACTPAAMRRSCGLSRRKPTCCASKTSSASSPPRSTGSKKQAKQAIRYRTVSAQVRKTEAMLFHLRWSAASIEVGGSRTRQGFGRARGRRTHRGGSRGLQAPGAGRRLAARAARGRSARRRRAAPAQRGATGTRPRGAARQGPHHRA